MISSSATTVIDENGDYYLQVNQEAPIYAATQRCIDWSHPEHGNVKTAINIAIQHILIGNKPVPASNETADVNMLTLNLSDEKWTETIDSLTAAGAFTCEASSGQDLKFNILRAANSVQHNILQLNSEDINRADPFDPNEEGLEELNFIAFAPISSLVADEGPSMKIICELAGMLGASTNNTRRREADADLQIMAAILKSAIHKFLGFTPQPSSRVAATQLKPLLSAAALDEVLRTGDTSITTLRNDWVDGFRQAPKPTTLST